MEATQEIRNIISVQDIRTRLADIANDAEAGRSFVVVRHSKPVFRIVPMEYDSATLRKRVREDFNSIKDIPPENRDISDEDILELVREVRQERRKAAQKI